jgi:hypothetical protein
MMVGAMMVGAPIAGILDVWDSGQTHQNVSKKANFLLEY